MPRPVLRRQSGFNLVEAAIILGIVGLVIGGIWVAAASVRQNYRINETALGILQIAENSRRVLPFSSYPTANGGQTNATVALNAAGASPFPLINNFLASPSGANILVIQSCYGTYPDPNCPMLSVSLYPDNGRQITVADCIQLIRRFGGLAKDNSSLLYVQVYPGSYYFYPPIDGATVSCPADWQAITFWFRP